MDIQLIRDRLVGEMATLPDLQTPEIQSYAVTTAVLVRQVTGALDITNLHISGCIGNRRPITTLDAY